MNYYVHVLPSVNRKQLCFMETRKFACNLSTCCGHIQHVYSRYQYASRTSCLILELTYLLLMHRSDPNRGDQSKDPE